MRVNAIFEGVTEQQVTYLVARTGRNISDVLRDSVDFYYRHMRAEGGQLRHLSNWIGKGDSGTTSISSKVKKHFGDGLDAKCAATSPKSGTAQKTGKSRLRVSP